MPHPLTPVRSDLDAARHGADTTTRTDTPHPVDTAHSADPAGPTDGPQSALGLVRHRWTLEILRAVDSGPQRHRDLLASVGADHHAVYPKTLNATLSHLCRHGLVCRRVLRERPRVVAYSHSPLGQELLEILETLEDFIAKHGGEFGPRSAVRDAQPP